MIAPPDSATNAGVAASGGWFAVAVAALATLVCGLFPLSSFDLWWHLASGREIWRRGSIPFSDPFSYASDLTRWIDHGWLFQILAYPLEHLGGATALSWLQGVIAFAIAVAGARQLDRDGLPAAVSAGLVMLALATAQPRLALRPEVVTLLLLTLLLGWLRQSEFAGRWPTVRIAVVIGLWINFHPGALLGSAVALTWILATLMIRSAPAASATRIGRDRRRDLRHSLGAMAAATIPLLANPYGILGVLFPFQLHSQVVSGIFVNPEWQPPSLATLPLLAVSLAVTAALLAGELVIQTRRRAGLEALGAIVPRLAVFMLLTALVLRYQRNIGVFAVAIPFLAGPAAAVIFRSLDSSGSRRWAGAIAWTAAGFLGVYALGPVHSPGGVDRDRIPVAATAFAKEAGVQGRVFNQVRFGGYLIWKLFPGQLVMIDGRNEVYTSLIPRLMRALKDDRQWRLFLGQQRIEWALLGYGNPLQRVELRRQTSAGLRSEFDYRPFGYNHFPPEEWALVYWDDVAMLLVRRVGVNRALVPAAPQHLWPEDPEFFHRQVQSGAWPRRAVEAELAAARAARPDSWRAADLARLLERIPRP